MSQFERAMKLCRLRHGGDVSPFRRSRPSATPVASPQAHPDPELQKLLDDEELTVMKQEAEQQAQLNGSARAVMRGLKQFFRNMLPLGHPRTEEPSASSSSDAAAPAAKRPRTHT